MIQLKEPVKMCEICWAQRVTELVEDDYRELVRMRLVTIVKPKECSYCQLRRMLAGTGFERFV